MAPTAPESAVLSALELLDGAAVAVRSDGSVVFWNRAAERLYGIPESAALGRRIAVLIPVPDGSSGAWDAILTQLDAGAVWRGRAVHGAANGECMKVDIAAVELVLGEERERGFAFSIKPARPSLVPRIGWAAADDAGFGRFVETLPEVVFELDRDGVLTYVNPPAFPLTGYDRKDFERGFRVVDLLAPDERERAQRNIADILAGQDLGPHQYRAARKDGSELSILIRSKPIVREGKTVGLCGVVLDVTEHGRLDETLARERAQLLSIFDGIGEIIYVADPHTHEILFLNDHTKRLLGTDPTGGRCYEAFQGRSSPCEFCTNEIILANPGQTHVWEFHNPVIDRDVLIFDRIITWPDGRDVRFELAIDITDRKQAERDRERLEAELAQAHRLEAIGQLAAGVAHDMNNILCAVMGSASLLAHQLGCDHPAAEDVDTIVEASRRGRELTHNLLGFARRGKYDEQVCNLNDVVSECAHLLARTAPKKISIRTALDPDLPAVLGDRTQLARALMNICVNSLDALEGAGMLSLTTRGPSLGEEEAARYDVSVGRYAEIQIADTGGGMAPETAARAFEPFFTTKPAGQGTGLGLSMVYGVMKSHRGAARVASEPGHGTTVTLLLPAVEGRMAAAAEDRRQAAPPTQLGAGLLLVDDEAGVRQAGRRMLERLGYRVFVATGGLEAVEVYRAHQREIALVILDLAMPVMDGAETFAALRRLDPRVRVLLSTGYSHDEQVEALLDSGAAGFLQKPFALEELAAGIDRVLR